MREKLDTEISSTNPLDRRDGAARRFGIPALVAAAVAALAIGGYVIADEGQSGGGADPDPAGRGQEAPMTDRQRAKAELASRAESRAKAAMAYQKCIDLTLQAANWNDWPMDEKPVGKLAIENELGTTVVVANSSNAYTCNIKPDAAVSHPSPLDGRVDESDFWFALNYTGNVLPGNKGDMAWVGGEVPEGVTGISYTFPDGHTEDAVVQDGFWALQYYTDGNPIPSGPKDRVEVTFDGPQGQTLELPFTIDTMCNQVSHGC